MNRSAMLDAMTNIIDFIQSELDCRKGSYLQQDNEYVKDARVTLRTAKKLQKELRKKLER